MIVFLDSGVLGLLSSPKETAQWRLLKEEHPGQEVVIATTNLKHLQRFTDADTWRNIK